MASIFKPTGKSKYVILYHDETGRRRKKTGATDKAVTKWIARTIESRVALRREGIATGNYPLRIIDVLLGTQLSQSIPPRIDPGPSGSHPPPPSLALYEDRLASLSRLAPCVYFLVRDDVVTYVGQTTNLYLRITHHRRDKRFDHVLYLSVEIEDLDRVERGFIAALQPEYNLQGKEI
jgi:predicted GIY-YIG superfamily endonuclease